MLPKNKLPTGSSAETLDEIFGEGEWRKIYKSTSIVQMSIFDEDDGNVSREQGINELLEYVESRYRDAFPCLCGPAILRTPTNSPLFALFALVTNTSKNAQDASCRIAKSLIDKIGQ